MKCIVLFASILRIILISVILIFAIYVNADGAIRFNGSKEKIESPATNQPEESLRKIFGKRFQAVLTEAFLFPFDHYGLPLSRIGTTFQQGGNRFVL